MKRSNNKTTCVRRVLSIDPGYGRVGIAVIEKDKNKKEILLYSDCFETNKETLFEKRLFAVSKEVEKIINEFKPNLFALEKLFFNKNIKTAMMVAQTKGAMIQIAISKNLPVYKYNTTQIKMAVTGYGKSTKDQVMRMLPKLIEINPSTSLRTGKKMLDDEYDAIAVGLTCLAIEK